MKLRSVLILGLGAAVVGGALAGALVTTGGSGASQAELRGGPYRGSEPPPGIRVPSVTLRSYQGGAVSLRKLRGSVLVVTFLDTKCTESCPIVAGAIGVAMPLLSAGERSHAKAFAITVYPRLDTPASIRSFLRRRRALGKLDFLIGSVKDLRPVWNAFHVVPAIDTGSADIHSAGVRLFDTNGVWVSTLHAGVDLTPANLVHDIRTALGQAR